MKINISNYESWFLDYHEGTLSAEKSAELFLFLEQFPELKEEFESFEMMFLADVDESTVYPDKASLKRNNFPDASTIQEWLIAEMEGDLNLQERSALLTFIANHPQFQNDRDLFSKTVSHADHSEKYPDKSALRKRIIGPTVTMRVYYAIAASLILLIGAWTVLKFMHPNVQNETADNGKDSILPINSGSHQLINSQQEHKLAAEHPASTVQQGSSTQKTNQPNPVLQNSNNQEQNIADQNISNKKKSNSHRSKSTSNSSKDSIYTLQHKIPTTNLTQENIAFISPSPTPLLNESEPFVFAERRYIQNIEVKDNTLANLQPEILLNEIKDKAATSVNKVTGEELLATSDKAAKLPAKSRLIQFAAWSLSKVSSNRINLKTEFDPNSGKLAAYVLEVGKKKWQRISDF